MLVDRLFTAGFVSESGIYVISARVTIYWLRKMPKIRGHTVDTIWTQATIRVPNSKIFGTAQRSLPVF